MKRRILCLLIFLFVSRSLFAQSTTVSGQVTDAGGQPWNNGTITAVFVINPSYPSFPQYSWTGGTLNSQVSSTLNATGGYSFSIPSNTAITPVNSQWRFQICPQASSPCFYTSPITITGGTQTVNATPSIILINLQTTSPPVSAYSTSEVTGAVLGSQFFLIGSGQQSCVTVSGNNCITWSSGAISSNSPLPPASSGPGPVFNVKNYQAPGNTQSSGNCTTSTLNLNCTDVTFTTANINQRVSCNANGGGSLFGGVPTTFTAFVDSHDMTLATSGGSFSARCVWGSPDDTAVTAALTAALAVNCSHATSGNLCGGPSPIIYFPGCCYNLFNTSINIAPPTGSTTGFTVQGDGKDITKIYWHNGSTNAQGAALTANGNAAHVTLKGFTMDGATQSSISFSNAALFMSASTEIQDVIVQSFQGAGTRFTSGIQAERFIVQGNTGDGLQCAPCNGEIYQSIISNNNGPDGNLFIQNTNGLPTGPGIRLVNSLVDECASPPCIRVSNSTDVWFIGASAFTGLQIDGTSYVHMNGGIYAPFNTDSNLTGMTILTGGVAEASDARFVGSGTGKCINNSGTFINNGANTCESVFATVTAASSSSTTATLTVNTQGANVSAVCSVGDTIQVQNVGVTGYNGYFKGAVTAVGTNTISYTTPGSNLGASSGGTMFCKGFVTYSGNLPYSTITPTPNTCYVTGTFGAITLCNQFIDRAVNIYRIKASSGVTTACTVAPLVTITDGTNTVKLNITTAKTSWDSSVDGDGTVTPSAGVGTAIFTPHSGTITVSTTAGTCTTSPTNFALTYTMQAVLDN